MSRTLTSEMKYLHKYLIASRILKQIQTWRVQHLHLWSALMSKDNTPDDKMVFDTQLLDILACPLSKKPLRYDSVNNELVCDEIGVAYPIVDNIPNLNPVHARMLKEKS